MVLFFQIREIRYDHEQSVDFNAALALQPAERNTSLMFSIPVEALGAFVLTCVVIELTPGPNMAYLAVLTASNGRRAGFAATLGIALGLLIVGVEAALGLAALLSNSILLYEALRWGGVAYLLWLAWDGWNNANETSPARTDGNGMEVAVFTRGLITNLLNPKAAVFYVAILPTFFDTIQPVFKQGVFLSIVYVFVASAIHSGIVLLAATARPLFEDPDLRRNVRRGFAIALAAIALWFAFNTSR